MSLVDPSGRTIGRTTSAADVIHDLGATFEVYTVLNPRPGVWTVNLFGADVPAAGEEVVFSFTSIENPVIPDETAPVTTAVLSGTESRAGWYTSDVTVTLSAVDPDPGDGSEVSGIAKTEYSINGGPAQTYTGPFVVSNDNLHHKIEFWSTDNAGNVEDKKSVEFMLVKHVLFASDTSCSGNALELSASRGTYSGLVHTNGNFYLNGSRTSFDAAVTGTCGVKVSGSRNVFAVPPAKAPAQPIPPNYVYRDLAPHCTMTFTGNVELSSVASIWVNDDPGSLQLEPGVYCATGNMTLTPSRVTGNVTLVAQGQVRLRGSYLNLTAFHKHILAFSGSASTSGNAISMEGSANTWEGIVLAPLGRVSVSGTNSATVAGAIIAKRIVSTNSEAAWSLPK
jgi:hypothetical protein